MELASAMQVKFWYKRTCLRRKGCFWTGTSYIQALSTISAGKPNAILVASNIEGKDQDAVVQELERKGVKVMTSDFSQCHQLPLSQGQSVVILAGRLPKVVFENIVAASTLPVILEGANTKALARCFGKPYIPIVRTCRTDHFSFLELENNPEMTAWAYTSHLGFFEWNEYRKLMSGLREAKNRLNTVEIEKIIDLYDTGTMSEVFNTGSKIIPEIAERLSWDKEKMNEAKMLFYSVKAAMQERHRQCFSPQLFWLMQVFSEGREIDLKTSPPCLSITEQKLQLKQVLIKPDEFFENFESWIRSMGQSLLNDYMKNFFSQASDVHKIARKLQKPFNQPENDKLLHMLGQLPEEVFESHL